MDILIKVFLLQIVVAVVILFVLKSILERDLIQSAIDRLSALDLYEENDKVRSICIKGVKTLAADKRAEIQAIVQRRFSKAKIEYVIQPELRMGLVINVAGQIIDFSLASRLKDMGCVKS